MRTFFTSDSHFGHDNIIKHCGRPCRERPFRDSAEMDRALMDAWNSVVSPGDLVYHLGDFSLRSPETVDAFLKKKLNGIKHLIVGNHDRTHGVTGWASMREMDKIEVVGQSVFSATTRCGNGQACGMARCICTAMCMAAYSRCQAPWR